MIVWEQGVIRPSEMDRSDALDEVFLRLAAEMPGRLADTIGNLLDVCDELKAAQELAAFAVRREIPVARRDRKILRDVITAHRGDRTSVDVLDKRARTNCDTQQIPAVPRHIGPARTHDPAAQTAVLPAIRPRSTGAHRRR